MADVIKHTKGKVIVALDIAKKSHDAIILLPTGKRIHMKVANSQAGYALLLERCSPMENEVQVAFEPTADYHRNIAFWLAEAGCECFLVSSLTCARAREMLFNTWDKNDRKDAGVILYLVLQGLVEPFHDPLRSGIFDIQEISNTYH